MVPRCDIITGDAFVRLSHLPPRSIQCCVTSPPYYGLRDYGHSDQIGSEETPEGYIQKIVELGRRVRRVLRDDGTFWLNLGDSYCNYRPGNGQRLGKQSISRTYQDLPADICHRRGKRHAGFKEKDRMMIPARCAIALHADGWYLRDEIVWHKPNPMVESVNDRCTKAHEMIYLLTKQQDYYYDSEAIKEKGVIPAGTLAAKGSEMRLGEERVNARPPEYKEYDGLRNKRSVWTVNTQPYPEAHFAAFPADLIKPCILAGSRVGDTILDPCAGRGTTGVVALELGRNAILIEINPRYAEMCDRNTDVTPGLPL